MKEIFERRSIRKYTDEPISAEHEEKLLRAAMLAFGHPAQTVDPIDRYLPERVHKEQW